MLFALKKVWLAAYNMTPLQDDFEEPEAEDDD
jgi:hypothetical protein